MLNIKTIFLAVELFQDGAECSMSFYCDVPKVKSGFMYINIGNEQPKDAFWKGIYLALNRMSKYQDRHLELALYPSYMTAFQGGKHQVAVMHLLKQFSKYTMTDSRPYYETLEKLSLLGKKENKPKGELTGYTLEQLDAIKSHTVKQLKEEIKENLVYTALLMPPRGVILDFETTSKIMKFGKIIEISALKFEQGTIVDEYHTLVNPVVKIPKAISELTGITQKDVTDAPRNYEAMKNLILFIKDCEVLVGHNIGAYDYKIVESFMKKFKFPNWEGKILCTMKLAKSLKLGYANHRLETLCDYFHVNNEQPHRAWSDTRATFEVMKSLFRESSLPEK